MDEGEGAEGEGAVGMRTWVVRLDVIVCRSSWGSDAKSDDLPARAFRLAMTGTGQGVGTGTTSDVVTRCEERELSCRKQIGRRGQLS